MRTREDSAAYMRRRYAERRALALSKLGGECGECGEKEAEKLRVVPRLARWKKLRFARVFSLSEKNFLEELKKFKLLCEKCKDSEKEAAYTHGGYHAYYRRGCRCDECGEWQANYILERREKRRMA